MKIFALVTAGMLVLAMACGGTQLYRGYSLTPLGSVIGLLWGLPDAALGGAVFAWLYNRLAGRNDHRAV